jgi:uncharacterized protein (TIGR03435 family)
LVIGNGGLKIREATPPPLTAESYISATMPETGVIAITGRRASMLELAETLQRLVKSPVWDRTGLSGDFYFAFRYTQVPNAEVETDAPSLGTALKRILASNLERQKGPVEKLVIDHIDEPFRELITACRPPV